MHIRLKGRHTGAYLARKIFKILEDYDLLAKVCYLNNTRYALSLTPKQLHSVIGDNASNMDTLVDHLYTLLLVHNPWFEGTKNRLRCFAHVLNLVMLVSTLPSDNWKCLTFIHRLFFVSSARL